MDVFDIIKGARKLADMAANVKAQYNLEKLGYSVSVFNPHSQSYKLGELVDINGIIGMVVESDSYSKHGKIMCIKSSAMKWGYENYANQNTNGRDSTLPLIQYNVKIQNPSMDDGVLNCKSMETEITEWDNNESHQHSVNFGSKFVSVNDSLEYSAYKYCKMIGKEWYLPAVNEIYAVFSNYELLTKVQHIAKISSSQEIRIWSSSYDPSKCEYDNYLGNTSYAYGLQLNIDSTISIKSFPLSMKALVFPFRIF